VSAVAGNILKPFDYLRHVLQAIAENPGDIDALLPWNIDLTQSAID